MMARQGMLLVVSVGLWLAARAQIDTSVCVPSKEEYQGPPLPVIPDTFTIRVEANLLNKNSTIDVREWHDGKGNRGASSVWISSVHLSYIYSYLTNQQVSFEREAGGRYGCKVGDLTSMKEPYLHGSDTVTTGNGSSHIYSAARALSFAGGVAERYLGRAKVRGIPTDTWTSCVYWRDMNATMKVTWYFTVPQGWDTAVGVAQVPVRCHVTGRVNSAVDHRKFDHLYEVTEFFHYLDLEDAQNVFETPPGTVCPHRKNSKAPPSLPDRFSYSTEVLNVNTHRVEFQKRGYDNQLKMTMYEYGPKESPHSRWRLIDDYNTGIRYTLNTQQGNCTVSAIGPFDNTALRMPTPHQQFFGLGINYTYEGTRSVRQLTSDVWIGKGTWSTGAQATVEFYFATPEWREKAGVTSAASMPIGIHVIPNGEVSGEVIYNIYDFRDGDPRLWEYDVTSCFDDNQGFTAVSLRFYANRMQFQAVSTNQNTFRRAVLDSVTSLVGISPVRLNNIQLEFGQELIDVEMVIVEAVNVTSQQPPLSAVLTRLQDAVNRQKLIVTFATPTGGSATLVAAMPTTTKATPSLTTTKATPSTTTAEATPLEPPTPSAPTSVVPTPRPTSGSSIVVCAPQSSGYTPGDVAGVTMGTTLACYVAALLGMSAWTRRRGQSGAYDRERLEMS